MRLSDLIDWPRAFFPEDPHRPVSISLASGAEREAAARDQLRAILDRHDLKRWQYTNRVRIQHGVVPHSHPILTLNTRYLDDDATAMSAYLHEQLHWFVWRRNPDKRRAIRELRRRYPAPPIAHPEGAGSAYGSYLHYLVCFMEYIAMIQVAGPDEARHAIDVLGTDHYTQIYRTVLDDYDAIDDVVRRHGLAP